MTDPALPFTGERFTPECVREIAYEHWHRYAFARPLVAAKQVLDAACGEGYGSALLAAAGAEVLGVDISAEAVEHARRRYAGQPRLRFAQGDATALDELPDGCVDVVVSFETLEHVEAQQRLLDGFARVLRPEGVLMISTPDRHTYSELGGECNPHHVRELYRDEFEALLATRFPHVRLYAQKLLFQSVLWDVAAGSGDAQALLAGADGIGNGLHYPPMYYLAVCARQASALPVLPALSLFGDSGESVYADYRDEVRRNRAAAAHIAHLEAELARLRGASS